jgi:hypothetical protein
MAVAGFSLSNLLYFQKRQLYSQTVSGKDMTININRSVIKDSRSGISFPFPRSLSIRLGGRQNTPFGVESSSLDKIITVF